MAELTEKMLNQWVHTVNERTTINSHLDHWSIAAFVCSWLIDSQQLFRTCFRSSVSLIFWPAAKEYSKLDNPQDNIRWLTYLLSYFLTKSEHCTYSLRTFNIHLYSSVYISYKSNAVDKTLYNNSADCWHIQILHCVASMDRRRGIDVHCYALLGK